ncbi:hypothetical protein OJ598_07465 [Streptococcus anginosus]|uniref:Uncharacterized protein n=1 Tax=Streptococcus parasanguinis TaxID=1318 RepID=A0A6L6LFC2_STRPA|nr:MULTISPECIES: hypothetical protein [Streptococcus]MCW0925448.1 hypothetical protein [Streptococcus anginosus]MTR62800.1 hypothetical protein [Streptococcus parasanguinis]MTR64641.1 hypothetical protein [Streptococcus parasanguinis]MTR67999.1 hypothetical protein [Streptococcus parasanguinis]MTS05342.1 hypothetical protein [Streptococcus parasanguinis]
MTNKELVNQISGLNSTSTLKNWIQLIKEISGKEFKKIKIPISRNSRTHQLSYTVAYDFTDEDLRQFQKLANLKLEIGLKEAIQKVFGSLADNEQELLNHQVIDELYDELSALKQEFKREIRLIKNENANLKKKIQDIEESMQTGLLGFVQKRSKNRFG